MKENQRNIPLHVALLIIDIIKIQTSSIKTGNDVIFESFLPAVKLRKQKFHMELMVEKLKLSDEFNHQIKIVS